MDDFYMILPSNTMQDNTPYAFNTQLPQPLILTDNDCWRVALLEMNFYRYSKHHGLYVGENSNNLGYTCHMNTSKKYEYVLNTKQQFYEFGEYVAFKAANGLDMLIIARRHHDRLVKFLKQIDIEIYETGDDDDGDEDDRYVRKFSMYVRVVDYENTLKFMINGEIFTVSANPEHKRIETADVLKDLQKFYSPHQSGGDDDEILYSIPLCHANWIVKDDKPNMKIVITEYYEGHVSTRLPENQIYHITDVLQLENFLKILRFNQIYYPNFSLNKVTNKWSCELPNELHSVTFHGGLHKVLGFQEKILNASSSSSSNGTMTTNLNALNDDSLFIYCNLCRDICVGNVRAPLLRQVVLPTEAVDEGVLENVVLEHAIYIPVRSNSINHIEFNIRNNTGEYFKFLPNSVTTLTLHFKRSRQ